ncbi:hypothetical protein WKT22_02750 [Candidatus Lokiarchaeum ossiferum]
MLNTLLKIPLQTLDIEKEGNLNDSNHATQI